MPENSQAVSVYFIASPLQLLAAEQIAATVDAGRRRILIWYKPGVSGCIRTENWDASSYMPWPRFEPLPGRFGAQRRLLANIDLVADLVGPCKDLLIHSAVFDSEAINYFLRALPRRSGATRMLARLLPDGIGSMQRRPLSLARRLGQHFRKLRRLASPDLDYWTFSGDRTGSEAPFVDRIYTLPGMPHDYPADRVFELKPLVQPETPDAHANTTSGKRALVIEQILSDRGELADRDVKRIATSLRRWLAEQGIEHVVYKPHPKARTRPLWQEGDEMADGNEALERWMSHHHFDAVASVRSTAMLFARSVYPATTPVAAFGLECVRFRNETERRTVEKAFRKSGIELRSADGEPC